MPTGAGVLRRIRGEVINRHYGYIKESMRLDYTIRSRNSRQLRPSARLAYERGGWKRQMTVAERQGLTDVPWNRERGLILY